MKSLACALNVTLLLASSAATAQTNATLRWAEGAPNATSEVKNDNKIEGLKSDDLQVFVSMADIKETEYNRVWVQVFNHGKTPITIDPQSVVLLNGEKPEKPDIPEKAASSIQKVGEAKSQEMSSAHCNLMSSGGKGGGAGGACQPTDTQVQMGKQIATFSAQQAQWVRDNAMKESSLAAGDQTQGAIVFRKDKKSANYILRVSVGNQTFEFPVSAQNKRPSYD
jgi:hypothetical protein